ncbi:MAG TPA: HD domain-containing protein [Ktedonobacterales bacterium]|jgi:hypothetical protein|nr:HD domain-containing protein [Ktedonobacterales bacterium]
MPATSLRAAGYRVYQVWRSLAARPLDTDDHAVLDVTLPETGRALFFTMSRNDQRHSLTVYRALRARGCADNDLLAAALLHDVGKGDGRVPFLVRPPVVLLRAFAPGALRWLARTPRPWFRRPFYHAWRHADIGADLAAQAGLSPRVVLLIRTHHQANGPAAELHAVDEEV